ncbi:MAG: ATP-grasp domain-containing protein, partial [Acidobacteria bacterium]|nr:ATP-grasp domain-containing protein [Acidobacteriota bacterium]
TEIREATEKIARGVGVVGLINIQYAIADNQLYVLEANPRASRTVPYVSKATGVQLAKAAAQICVGAKLLELRERKMVPNSDVGIAHGISVKEAVLPWNRFRRTDGKGVDSVLGPEMRSTGEVMGIADNFGTAYAKSQIASFGPLPQRGSVFLSLSERDKSAALAPATELFRMGFTIYATSGTHSYLAANGVSSTLVRKHSEPNAGNFVQSAVEIIAAGQVDLVINTPLGRGTRQDGWLIRTAAIQRSLPCITTIPGFRAAVAGIQSLRNDQLAVRSLQSWLS